MSNNRGCGRSAFFFNAFKMDLRSRLTSVCYKRAFSKRKDQRNIFQLFITFSSCLPFNAKDAIFTPDALRALGVLRSREIVAKAFEELALGILIFASAIVISCYNSNLKKRKFTILFKIYIIYQVYSSQRSYWEKSK